MSDVREVAQAEAKRAWLGSNRKNTIIAATGAGKSKIALDIIKEIDPVHILLLTNAVTLRDTNWKNEFDKFGMLGYWENTMSQTYQAMYNREWGEYDLVVMDEIDFACSPMYGKCMEQAARSRNVLCMTGFITEDKKELLEQHFPICYQITTEQMQEDNLLNQSEFIFIEFPLLKDKVIEQKTKKGTTFKVSENDQYQYWDKKFQQAMIVKSGLYKKYRQMFMEPETQKDYINADWNFKMTATKRKNILHNLESSVKVVKTLIDHIHSRTGNKIVIFSVLTKQADKFPNPYHTKSTGSSIEALNDGRINTLSVIRKITRGVNLNQVNYFVRESYDGSEEQFHQTHGRALRLRPDQVAKYIILVPYFESLVRHNDGVFRKTILPTQAGNWVEKMMQNFKPRNVRYIKLDSNYTIKEGIEI